MYSPGVTEDEINVRYRERLQNAEKLRNAKEYGIYHTTWIHEPFLEGLKDFLYAVGEKLQDAYYAVSDALILRRHDRQKADRIWE